MPVGGINLPTQGDTSTYIHVHCSGVSTMEGSKVVDENGTEETKDEGTSSCNFVMSLYV